MTPDRLRKIQATLPRPSPFEIESLVRSEFEYQLQYQIARERWPDQYIIEVTSIGDYSPRFLPGLKKTRA